MLFARTAGDGEGPSIKIAEDAIAVPELGHPWIHDALSGVLGRRRVGAHHRHPDEVDPEVRPVVTREDFVPDLGHAEETLGSGGREQHDETRVRAIAVEAVAEEREVGPEGRDIRSLRRHDGRRRRRVLGGCTGQGAEGRKNEEYDAPAPRGPPKENTRMRRRAHCLSLVFLAAVGAAQAQRDFTDVKITVTHVRGPIHMLEGAGGNIAASAGDDGVLVVDDQFAPLVPKIREAIAGLSKGELRFVLNTHFHGDHVGGNRELGAEATIIAHENVRKRVMVDSVDGERKAEPRVAWPVITFDESLSVHFNGEEIEAVHFAHGHTDGDAVIFFRGSNVVHMGDHFFSGRFPFVDLDSGGDVVTYTANVKQVLDKVSDDVKLIPGHGPLSSKADLAAFHAMLTESLALVRSAIAAGKTRDEVVAAGVPEKYKSWSWQFIDAERWLGTVFDSLGK